MKNKNILLTGITGFVGSHLAVRLKPLGYNIFGISRSMSGKNILKLDIMNYPALEKFIVDSKINICFHLAGESLVETGQRNPYDTFKINLVGTLNVLEIARKSKLERVIIASTTHVYGQNKLPYYEGYTPRPTRPYETSKTCTDLIAQSYASTYKLPVLIPRFVNIYGPGDLHFDRLIPKTIKAIISHKSPEIWGGNAVRDYLYIDDAVDAYIALLKINLNRVIENRIFNFGSGNRLSVKEVVEKIINLSNSKITIKKLKDERVEEIPEQYVSFKKAGRLLKWAANTDFEDGIRKTLSWYTKYFSA